MITLKDNTVTIKGGTPKTPYTFYDVIRESEKKKWGIIVFVRNKGEKKEK